MFKSQAGFTFFAILKLQNLLQCTMRFPSIIWRIWCSFYIWLSLLWNFTLVAPIMP